MAVIFNQCNVGGAMCISMKTEGCTPPAAIIDFNLIYNGVRYNPWSSLVEVVDQAYTEELKQWAERLGETYTGGPVPPSYGEGILTGRTAPQEQNFARAKMPLRNAIFPLGIVTGIGVDYADPYTSSSIRITSQSPAQALGTGSITGVAFDNGCEALMKSIESERAGHHGLEGILDYYYNNRISNAQKNVSITQLKIGKTVIDSWVVGLSIQPQNFDYRLWQWTIKLALTPQFEGGYLKSGR